MLFPEDEGPRLPSAVEQFRTATEELRRAREEFGMARPEDIDLACARLGMAEVAFSAALRRAREERALAWPDGGAG
jgi:hypothetical protein